MSVAPSNTMILSNSYRSKFVLTSHLEEDLRYIRKLNTLFNKLEKSGKESYAQEIINVVQILSNSLFLEKALSVFYNVIDMKYHADMENIIFNMIEKTC